VASQFSTNLIKLRAIDFAAYINQCATLSDRDIIATYGGLVYNGIQPTNEQQKLFWGAMKRSAGDEYLQLQTSFYEAHCDHDATLLENETARWVAKLNGKRGGQL
jgi:hypothetical protein